MAETILPVATVPRGGAAVAAGVEGAATLMPVSPTPVDPQTAASSLRQVIAGGATAGRRLRLDDRYLRSASFWEQETRGLQPAGSFVSPAC